MATSDRRDGNAVTDTLDLVKAYALQEVVDPLKQAGRYGGYGAIGALLLGLGSILLLVSLLRVLQTETGDAFDGNWSFVPYLIVLIVGALVVALSLSRIKRGGPTKERVA